MVGDDRPDAASTGKGAYPPHAHHDRCTPQRRIVILGASNATIGLSTIVQTARQIWGHPLEVMAAVGHGRSYGAASRVLGRTLPGILHCDLWRELAARPALPTAALLTDIGNDIIYGRTPNVLLEWVENCLQRLAPNVERLVVTRLPIATLMATSTWKLHLLVSLIFPSSRVVPTEALARATEVDQALCTFAARFGAYVVQPEPSWYGWDPIHISRVVRQRLAQVHDVLVKRSTA